MNSQASSKKKWVVLCLILAAGFSGATYWWQVARFIESTDNAYLQSDIIYVSAKQSGYAEAGWINDNQHVTEGEILARIESHDYQLKVQEAEAQVRSVEADMNRLHAQHELQQSLIQVDKADLASAKATLNLASSDLGRMKSLFDKGVASREELDYAVTENLRAAAQVQGAKARIESSERELDVLDSRLTASMATLKQAQAHQAIIQQSLDETVITAPRSGVIGQRQVKDGQLIKAGSVLFSLVDIDTVWVTANFKETQISGMSVGQPVELTMDAFPRQPVTGYIASIWPASGSRFSLLPPENATGNFTKIIQRIPVKIVIPSDQPLAGKLRAGMSVLAEVDTQSNPVDISQMKVTGNNLSRKQHSQQLAGY